MLASESPAVSEVVGQVICDLGQTILEADDDFLALIGRERHEVVGRKALAFTFAADASENQGLLDRLTVGGPSFAITKRYLRGDQRLAWVRNQVTLVRHGLAGPVIVATSNLIDRPFRLERLETRYRAVQWLCAGFLAGKRVLPPNVVSAPPVEALLWLYRAELEGRSLSLEGLAAALGRSVVSTVRWVSVLELHGLAEREEGGVGEAGAYRISRSAQAALDAFLARPWTDEPARSHV